MKLHSFEFVHIGGTWVDYEDLKPVIGRLRGLVESPRNYDIWVRNKLGDILDLLELEDE